MQLNYLAFAVPLFVGLMGLEYYVSQKKGKNFFDFGRSITNINVGIAERLFDALITGSVFFFYDYLQRHFGMFQIRPSALLWVTLLLCTDLVWYWYHRLAHEINLFWAAHIVHHQSEDFNYTVSARITVFQALIRTGFWAILPVIGFPAGMITSMLLVHGLYPFFIHTRTIGKLGILEYIFVTPSHHRVHHGSNPRYLDKNYGDVFIIWDKLFGTFQKEDEEVVYGLTKPLESHSFLWQHFHFLLEVFVAARQRRGFVNKCKVIFGRPDDIDARIRPLLEKQLGIRPNHSPATRELNRYVIIQVIGTLAILFGFLLLRSAISWPYQTLFIAFIVVTLVNCGAILEQRRWIFYLEYSRLMLLVLGGLLRYPSAQVLICVVAGAAISLYYFNRMERRYLSWLY